MEQYCITLEQAKKLTELGFSRTCQFRWKDYYGSADTWYLSDSMVHDNEGALPAYHVGELGEILHDSYSDIIYRSHERWLFKSWEPQATNLDLDGEWPTEAQARGALLIYLIENNLL